MNNTKWNELFRAFYQLENSDQPFDVQWMTNTNGFIYGWDDTWSHFGCEPRNYKAIEWLKIKLTPHNREIVLNILKNIHVPGEIINDIAIIYGYRTDIDYI